MPPPCSRDPRVIYSFSVEWKPSRRCLRFPGRSLVAGSAAGAAQTLPSRWGLPRPACLLLRFRDREPCRPGGQERPFMHRAGPLPPGLGVESQSVCFSLGGNRVTGIGCVNSLAGLAANGRDSDSLGRAGAVWTQAACRNGFSSPQGYIPASHKHAF